MGLLQKACETYDAMAYRVGIVYENEAEPLSPIFHTTARAHIEITLNQSGAFVSARAVSKEEPKIIIPVTEESAVRTSGLCAHPLCDKLAYVSPYNREKHALYIAALSAWTDSKYTHPKLQSVLAYVRGGTILADLSRAELIKLTAEGAPDDDGLMICWVINGLGEGVSGPCWTDRTLMDAFIRYSRAKQEGAAPALCMVSGEMDVPLDKHPKGILPGHENAKLITSNDSSGFTYRGRFSEDWPAATVGYMASQKAHNALRWLVANQGTFYDKRAFLCWNPQGIPVPSVTGPMSRKSGNVQRPADPSQYRKQLHEALVSWKTDLPDSAGVAIAAFDITSKKSGRLSITYYNELPASDFLDRLCDWDASCCWERGPYGTQSPSLSQIVNMAFGTPRNGEIRPPGSILGQQVQRLMACRVDKAPFPLDIERALVEKASNLLIYDKGNRKRLLFTACAAVRKYHYDHLKEEWNMALDENCSDRSYLFGRMLAIADAVENIACASRGERETNALRMQKVFALRPMATWRILEEKLEPYYKQLKPGLRQHYRRLTQKIVDRISVSDSTLNQKLGDIYLLGYYHQRSYRSEKHNRAETEELGGSENGYFAEQD